MTYEHFYLKHFYLKHFYFEHFYLEHFYLRSLETMSDIRINEHVKKGAYLFQDCIVMNPSICDVYVFAKPMHKGIITVLHLPLYLDTNNSHNILVIF